MLQYMSSSSYKVQCGFLSASCFAAPLENTLHFSSPVVLQVVCNHLLQAGNETVLSLSLLLSHGSQKYRPVCAWMGVVVLNVPPVWLLYTQQLSKKTSTAGVLPLLL